MDNDEGKLIKIISSRQYGKPEGTLLIRSKGDGYYKFEEQEWAPKEFWDWYCDFNSGYLYIYDQGTAVITQYEIEHLSEIIFIDGQEYE